MRDWFAFRLRFSPAKRLTKISFFFVLGTLVVEFPEIILKRKQGITMCSRLWQEWTFTPPDTSRRRLPESKGSYSTLSTRSFVTPPPPPSSPSPKSVVCCPPVLMRLPYPVKAQSGNMEITIESTTRWYSDVHILEAVADQAVQSILQRCVQELSCERARLKASEERILGVMSGLCQNKPSVVDPNNIWITHSTMMASLGNLSCINCDSGDAVDSVIWCDAAWLSLQRQFENDKRETVHTRLFIMLKH